MVLKKSEGGANLLLLKNSNNFFSHPFDKGKLDIRGHSNLFFRIRSRLAFEKALKPCSLL